MLPTIIIGAAIIAYVAFVIVRQVRNLKKGQGCACGCSSCPQSAQCPSSSPQQTN